MNIKGSKVFIGLLLLLILVSLFIFRAGGLGTSHNQQLMLETFQSGNGWGYQILLDGKILVHQPTIPAIDTVMPFPNKQSALYLGQLVLERISSNKGFSVSSEEARHSLSY